MRIISGQFRGRLLSSPSGRDTRPTSARARGALFEILKERLDGAYVADLFAGTGALGLEALSRGAARVDFYENHRAALACLRVNIEALAVRSSTRVVSAPLPDSLTRGDRYDLVFMDPPWREGHELRVSRKLVSQSRLADQGLLVIESPRDEPLEESLWDELGLTLVDKRNYGDTELRFFSPKTAPIDPQ